jgi:thiol-disulfide isomerase/thioredoxin
MRFLFTIFSLLIGCVTVQAAPTHLSDFTLEVKNGEPGQMYSSANDKPMLIEFYFFSCSACNANAPAVERMARDFNNERTNVIEFGYDCSDQDYARWIARHAPSAFVLNGCDSPVFDALDINSFPTTIVVDAHHDIIKRVVGTWSAQDERDIHALMGSFSP